MSFLWLLACFSFPLLFSLSLPQCFSLQWIPLEVSRMLRFLHLAPFRHHVNTTMTANNHHAGDRRHCACLQFSVWDPTCHHPSPIHCQQDSLVYRSHSIDSQWSITHQVSPGSSKKSKGCWVAATSERGGVTQSPLSLYACFLIAPAGDGQHLLSVPLRGFKVFHNQPWCSIRELWGLCGRSQ